MFIIVTALPFTYCRAASAESLSLADREARCMSLRYEASELIRREKNREALAKLLEVTKYVSSVFSICKTCELLYKLDEFKYALELLRTTIKFDSAYMFELKDALELLKKYHPEEEGLISILTGKISLKK